jgi:hypothetical protein
MRARFVSSSSHNSFYTHTSGFKWISICACESYNYTTVSPWGGIWNSNVAGLTGAPPCVDHFTHTTHFDFESVTSEGTKG